MNKKGLGLSIGLASVIAVGTFVSPYLSSTTLIGDNNVESNKLNDSKYSVAIKSNDVLTPNAEKEEKEKALKEIRNSQVRNVLNDSTKTISHLNILICYNTSWGSETCLILAKKIYQK